ncbi:ComEC/Rec2 family competence protein [[Clostridium] dakarense]|uniref:ComEC/Rec2 family competence protein n=1 Tax=Faecalimicrobium dakarense TaxID=1301100 RepID=UPI0004AF81CA|nr:ComEC/Rec2 family competence protein [[Clostridium] dakarense]
MRRPLLIVFVIIIFVSFIYTRNEKEDVSYDNKNIIIEDLVKDKKEKVKYNEYEVGEFLIRDYKKGKNIKIGQIIKVKGKFKSLDKINYEDFNYGRYLKSNGYKGLIYISSYKVLGENKLYISLGNIKTYIRDATRYLYKETSDFINSIIIGEKENLKQEDKDMFSKTGTSHIIAISGLHTSIFCVLISFIIGGINKYYKLIILSFIIFLYSIMVGASPSIVRSVIFTIILYLAVFIDKKRDQISTLSMIGIFLIINNPYIIYNISFQLSFLATLSIIYFYGYINNIIKISLISLTLSANILTLPIVYYNFKGIPVISVISNIIIVPFIGIIMYLSIISVALFKINIQLAKLISNFNGFIINIIYFLLEKLSNLYFSYIEVNNPSMYCVIIYYTLVFSYMIYKEQKVMKEQKNELQGYYK